MNKSSILIIDDDVTLSGLVSAALKDAGYRTRHEKSADAAVKYLSDQKPDLILLDIRLPGISGMKVLEMLKADAGMAAIPVIMMTSEGATPSKVQGLKTGADDYLVKPFSMPELTARVEALLRRIHHAGKTDRTRSIGEIQIDFDQRQVTAKGKPVDLTAIEFDILSLLTERPGNVASYQAIRGLCRTPDVSSETLHSHVNHLRKKLGKAGDRIENVHGLGYKILAD